MQTNKTCDKANWVVTIIALITAILSLFVAFFELGESKLANRLMMVPDIDIVGVDKVTTKEFYFMIKNSGKVDIYKINYEYVVLSRGKDDKYRKHVHASVNLEGDLLKVKKDMPLKIKLNKPILSEDRNLEPLVFIGLKIKYKREVDAKDFEEKFYYYLFPDPTKRFFKSGPIKIENLTAKIFISDILRIDEELESLKE